MLLKTSLLHTYPFLRLIIPWIAGVFFGDRFHGVAWPFSWGILLLAGLMGIWAGSAFLKKYEWRWCFGAILSVCCFLGGWLHTTFELKRSEYSFPSSESVYRIRLVDKPEQRERSIRCRVLVHELHDSTSVRSVRREALLYFQNDSAVLSLKAGGELLVSTHITPSEQARHSLGFDYSRYLKREGVSGTGVVATGKWRLLACDSSPTWRERASRYREAVLERYRLWGLSSDEMAVLAALTVGDKTGLSESIRESYSVSGAAHVLALSGLHVGLLYALFYFLSRPLVLFGRRGVVLRALLLIGALWTFAYFTGLSPSVVRSACMFSLLTLGGSLGRRLLSLNSLMATAFLMLVFHPVWLFDVGFQLSFAAVVSISLFHPLLYRCVPVSNRLVGYVWSLISISTVAQIGTLPLVLLYFGRFPTHFLLTNLLVIPLITLILYTVVLLLLLTPFAVAQALTAVAVSGMLLRLLNSSVRMVEQWPFSSFDFPLGVSEVVFLYAFFFGVLAYIHVRRARNLVMAMCFLLLAGISHVITYRNDRPERSIVFYAVRGCPAVHCIESNGRSWLYYGDVPSVDSQRLRRMHALLWRRQRLDSPVDLPTPDHEEKEWGILTGGPFLSFHGRRVCVMTDDRWSGWYSSSPMTVHFLYLCRGCRGSLTELMQTIRPASVLIGASVPLEQAFAWKEECRAMGLPFHDMAEEGNVRFLL